MRKITFNPKRFVLELTKQYVGTAVGCTEIGIVSLAAAKAASLLPYQFDSAKVKVSTSIYRNDARVGVPNIGICGISTIAAIGFILKNPERKLSCSSDVNKSNLSKILKLGASKKIIVDIDYNADPVYTYVKARDVKNNVAEVLIKENHDNIVSAKINGKETIKSNAKHSTTASCGVIFDEHVDDLPLQIIFNICKKLTIAELKFLLPTIKMNENVSDYGKKYCSKEWLTHGLLSMYKHKYSKNKKQNDLRAVMDEIILNVCSGVETRMYGVDLPVATSANSGDHGLVVSLTISTFAKATKCSQLKTLQALIFTHYITWYIKSHVGHLCGMCGCAIAAAPAAICGVAFLMGWKWAQINDLLNAMMCSQANILCDGAKPSCAYKCISALQNGLLALELVGQKKYILSSDGIVHKNVEKTIRNYKFISQKTLKPIVHATVEMLDHMSKK